MLSQSPFIDLDGQAKFANSSIYQAPSGAWVFDAGTIAWSWGLGNFGSRNLADPRIQETTANILDKFVKSHGAGEIHGPSDLSAIVGPSGAVYLTWTDNAGGVDTFVIERTGKHKDWDSALVIIVAGNITSTTDNSTASNTIYDYRVKATIGARSSDYSNTEQIDTGLRPPTGLSAIASGGYLVNLSWTDNASSEKGFTVERSADGTNWTVLSKLHANNTNDPLTTYPDSSVIPQTTYYYRLKATEGDDSSAYSKTANVTTPNDIPLAPNKLEAKAGRPKNNPSILLDWTDNATNETGFVIERSTAADFTANFATVNLPANTTSYTDNLVQADTT